MSRPTGDAPTSQTSLAPGTGLEAAVELRRSATFHLQLELSIPPGRTVALLGPNGAGKSSAVAALAGLIPLDAGRILLNGVVLDDPVAGAFVPPEERGVGVVFQDALLFPHLTVLENVAFGIRSGGVGRAAARERARGWMERLDLGGLGDRRPRDLSGGQAQRVALARALATAPDLLLLDEPLSALDVTTRTTVRRVIADHLDDVRGPRLLITHDPAEAFLLADEIHILEEGRITQSGTAEEIRLRPVTPYAADLAGSNLFRGVAQGGDVDTGDHTLHIADHQIAGPVLLTIRANAVSLHPARPEGSFRNRWRTPVVRIERLGHRARLLTGAPLPMTIEMTTEALDELGLAPGSETWVALKATEIGVRREGG